jgi:hypothetical protein
MTSAELDEYTKMVIAMSAQRLAALARELSQDPKIEGWNAGEALMLFAQAIEDAGEGNLGTVN